jgi:hypothetical protein
MKVIKRLLVQAQLTAVDQFGKLQYFIEDEKSKDTLTNALTKLDPVWAKTQLFKSEKSDRTYFKLKTDMDDSQRTAHNVENMHMMLPVYIDVSSYNWEGKEGYCLRLFNP